MTGLVHATRVTQISLDVEDNFTALSQRPAAESVAENCADQSASTFSINRWGGGRVSMFRQSVNRFVVSE